MTEVVGLNSVMGTAVIIVSNLVGAGMLSLPFTLRRAGYLGGSIEMIVMALLNTVVIVSLARSCDLAKRYTYRELAEASFGKSASFLVSALLALYTTGSCVSFVVLLGDFLPAIVCFSGCEGPVSSVIAGRSLLLVLVGAIVLFPLSLPRNLSALRYTSVLAFLCVIYTAGLIVIRAAKGPTVPFSKLSVARGAGAGISIPILAVAFTLHYNGPKYYAELIDRDIPRFSYASILSFSVVLVIYLALALGGYMLFGDNTSSDILNNFDTDDIFALIARIALAAVVTACYPLVFNSLRSNVLGLLLPLFHLVRPALRKIVPGSRNSEHREVLIPDSTESQPLPQQGSSFVNLLRREAHHIIITGLLVSATVAIGIRLPDISVVLDYKGALGGSLIVYILPSLMLFSLTMQKRRWEDMTALANLQEGKEGVEGVSRSAWKWVDLVSSPTGVAALAFCVFGMALMCVGTLATALKWTG